MTVSLWKTCRLVRLVRRRLGASRNLRVELDVLRWTGRSTHSVPTGTELRGRSENGTGTFSEPGFALEEGLRHSARLATADLRDRGVEAKKRGRDVHG